MGVASVFWLVILSSIGHVTTEDMSYHSTDQPAAMNPVDNKGIVLVAVISTIAIIILMMLVLFIIYYRKRCRKRAREYQECDGGNGKATPLMTIIGKDVDTVSTSTRASAI